MSSADVSQILLMMQGEKPPTPVVKWDVQPTTDADGDEAIIVWAIVDGPIPSAPDIIRLRDHVTEAVGKALPKPAPWVYLRLRTVAGD